MKSKKPLILGGLIVVILIALLLINRCGDDPNVTKHASNPAKTQPQVVFMVPEEGVQSARDYNQRVVIPIRNDGPGTARIRLESSYFPDLPVGFVGRGTPDWEVPDTVLQIPVGEIWEVPLLIHGHMAEKDTYQVTLKATHEGETAGTAPLEIHLEKPKLELETTWIMPTHPVEQARLMRTLSIRNAGSKIANLSIQFEPKGNAPAQPLQFDPVLELTTLATGEKISVSIIPYLYPSFESLQGDIVLTGLNQEHRVPYEAKVPEGKSVFVTLSRTTSRMGNSGTRCTNQPGSSYSLPATNGTPARTDWGGGSSSGGGFQSGGSMTGGSELITTDSNLDPDSDADDEENEDGSFTLFGPVSNAGDDEDSETKEEGEEKSEKNDENDPLKTNPDTGTFDNLDANTEGVVNGFIPPDAFGYSLRDESRPPSINLVNPQPDPEADGVPEGAITTFGPKRDKKESASYADKKGKRTHVTRRSRDDGAEFINFGWGIAGKGRKLNGYFGPTPIRQPVLGPNPRPDAPALATFIKDKKDGKPVVETLDPETGQSVVLSDPEKSADSPVSLETNSGVETIFREDGAIKRIALDESLNPTPRNAWPAGERTGPILAAESLDDGKLALLTRETDGIQLRTESATRSIPATNASMASLDGQLMVATRQPDGRIQVLDPSSGKPVYQSDEDGFGPPALVNTADGGLRMYYHKPIPEKAPQDGSGAALGGNFMVEYRDGQWGEPKRAYMPDAPVTDAAVAVEFTAPFNRAHYKKMNTGISLNGRQLQTLKEQIPFGRYLFQVPTSALGYRADANPSTTANNQIVIDSEGIGPGNFLISDKASIYGLHDWTQGSYVASSNDEADQLAQLSSPQLRHNAHDLILATNGAQLPRDIQPGETREFTFSAFNAGDQTSPAGQVTIRYQTLKIGSGELPALPSFRGAPVTATFTVPETWQPDTNLRITARAPSKGDADPTTNSLALDLLQPYQPKIAGPVAPVGIVPAQLPEETLTSVAAATADQPARHSLNGREWFRLAIPPEGDLQIRVTGPNIGMIDGIDLFDRDGRVLQPQSGKWQAAGDELFIRVGLPPGTSLPADNEIELWWETPTN